MSDCSGTWIKGRSGHRPAAGGIIADEINMALGLSLRKTTLRLLGLATGNRLGAVSFVGENMGKPRLFNTENFGGRFQLVVKNDVKK